MYNFIVTLKAPALNFTLGYKDEASAKTAREKIHSFRKKYFETQEDSQITIKDDYGHQLDVEASNIASTLIQNQYGATERDQDQNIDNARFGIDFKNRLRNEPDLAILFPQNTISPAFQGGRPC